MNNSYKQLRGTHGWSDLENALMLSEKQFVLQDNGEFWCGGLYPPMMINAIKLHERVIATRPPRFLNDVAADNESASR